MFFVCFLFVMIIIVLLAFVGVFYINGEDLIVNFKLIIGMEIMEQLKEVFVKDSKFKEKIFEKFVIESIEVLKKENVCFKCEIKECDQAIKDLQE